MDESDTARTIAEQEVIAERCGCQAALMYWVSGSKDLALCCVELPAGYSRRALRLLGNKAVGRGIVEHGLDRRIDTLEKLSAELEVWQGERNTKHKTVKW
ncbi:MAG: hypothetical protein LBB98_08230 [Treponema sp.]|nr:hypothetical protein [Treponema sp.]